MVKKHKIYFKVQYPKIFKITTLKKNWITSISSVLCQLVMKYDDYIVTL